jgi:hypothetical protein
MARGNASQEMGEIVRRHAFTMRNNSMVYNPRNLPPHNCNGFLSEVDPRIASSLSIPGRRAWFDSHVGRPLASVTSDCCARL